KRWCRLPSLSSASMRVTTPVPRTCSPLRGATNASGFASPSCAVSGAPCHPCCDHPSQAPTSSRPIISNFFTDSPGSIRARPGTTASDRLEHVLVLRVAHDERLLLALADDELEPGQPGHDRHEGDGAVRVLA